MQRIKEEFLEKIEKYISLRGKYILEVGAGDGSRSVAIAKRCEKLTAIEPDKEKVKAARERNISNATFEIGSGDALPCSDHIFDLVIFTLSLHHIPEEKMNIAINEAIRVTRENGYIVFLEPTDVGTFFDAEIKFDACDGDERKEKEAAYKAMGSHKGLKLTQEIADETIFQFQSLNDFMESMAPKKNLDEIRDFLQANDNILRAGRRINIFQAK
ncbi:MAG: class I SAM-dependent methyltransferase [Candidatus Harrisonbacteria bacterium]|nr:class I SAM-dependent methyltransferase [Candidatus Harrisonbacteria bacterium]